VVVTKEGPDHAITQHHNLQATIVPLMAHLLLKTKDAMKTHVLLMVHGENGQNGMNVP
jgi:hypothetical protein